MACVSRCDVVRAALALALSACAATLSGCGELLGLDDVGYRQAGAGGSGGGGVGGAGGAIVTGGAAPLDGHVLWARRTGAELGQRGVSASFDGDGDVVVVGALAGSLTFATVTHSNAGGEADVVVLGYSAEGAELWGRSFGDDPAISARGVSAGRYGLVVGRYDGAAVNPGGGALPDPSPDPAVANQDLFAAKYDDEGDYKWSLVAGGPDHQAALAAAAAGASDLFLGGTFGGTTNLGPSALVSFGGLDGFVGRLVETPMGGGFAWAVSFGAATEDERVTSLATTSFGDVVALGRHTPLGAPSADPADLSVRRLAGSDGSAAWTVPVVFGAGLRLGAVAVDPSDHVLLVSSFSGNVTTPTGELLATGANDLLVAQIDAQGTLMWTRQYPSDGEVDVRCAAVDGSGHLLITGSLAGSLALGTLVLQAEAPYDAFALKLDAAGQPVWAQRFGDAASPGPTLGRGCGVAPTGESLLTGAMQGTINFGSNILTAAEGFDLFVAKLAP